MVEGARMRRVSWVLVACLGVLVFALSVWPTPYRYLSFGTTTVRENRVIGGFEILSVVDGKIGWHKLGEMK